jgi:hypothetical protein
MVLELPWNVASEDQLDIARTEISTRTTTI